MATRRVALTPEAAKKKLEAVSEGTTLGIDCSIISRMTTPRIVPIKNRIGSALSYRAISRPSFTDHANCGRTIKSF